MSKDDYIYAYVRQDPWIAGGPVFVWPVNERAFNRRCCEAEKHGKRLLWLITKRGDDAYWHWYYEVPEKHRNDYRHGETVRVKVDPAIFEVT